MMIYILKSTFCLALMLAMYFLFLEKEKMYRFNRFYLLFSIVFSYLVPFNSITVYSQVTMVVRNYPVQVHHIGLQNLATPIKYVQPERDLLMPFLLIVYCLGAAYFLFRYIKNIYLIFSRISRSEIIVLGNAKIVLLEQDIISYTFLHYVFINATLYKEQHMEREVFTHELTHVRQKHSLDVLFIELLQVFFWFNPILILYKKAIQLNHEFLADEAVISTFNNVKHYQQLLINKISLNNSMCLTSSFNYQVTKKRLIMMTMTTNHWRALYKKAATVSLIVSAVYLFSTRVEAKHISYLRQPETRDTKAYPKKKIAVINVKNHPNVVKATTDTIIKQSVKQSEEKRYSIIISGSDGLGPNPLVLIDNKEYPASILYEIGKSCIKGYGVPALIFLYIMKLMHLYLNLRIRDWDLMNRT